jgi:hypothetical protein
MPSGAKPPNARAAKRLRRGRSFASVPGPVAGSARAPPWPPATPRHHRAPRHLVARGHERQRRGEPVATTTLTRGSPAQGYSGCRRTRATPTASAQAAASRRAARAGEGPSAPREAHPVAERLAVQCETPSYPAPKRTGPSGDVGQPRRHRRNGAPGGARTCAPQAGGHRPPPAARSAPPHRQGTLVGRGISGRPGTSS